MEREFIVKYVGGTHGFLIESDEEHKPLIRCKDCRFRDDAVARASVTQWMPCEECRPYDEWFCAFGERKDGDANA